MPGSLLCFKLIRKAGCSKAETQIIIKDVDFAKTDDEIYKAAKTAHKKYRGELVAGSKLDAATIKLEEADLAQHEDVLATFGYKKARGAWRGGRGGPGGPGRGGGGYYGGNSGRGRGNEGDQSGGVKAAAKKRNPKDEEGNYKRCRICDSINHYAYDCPDKNSKVEDANFADVEEGYITEDFVLFTGDENEQVLLSVEAGHSAVIDTACTSTVCGEKWLRDFEAGLSIDERKSVKSFKGEKK